MTFCKAFCVDDASIRVAGIIVIIKRYVETYRVSVIQCCLLIGFGAIQLIFNSVAYYSLISTQGGRAKRTLFVAAGANIEIDSLKDKTIL